MASAAAHETSADRRAHAVTLAVFLCLCVVLGGSMLGAPLFDLVLQLTACVLLAWCVLDRSGPRLGRSAIMLMGLLAALLLVLVLQLAPLPLDFWRTLPGREEVANVLDMLSASEAALPITLAPQATLEALVWLLPPVAILVLVLKLETRTVVAAGRWTIPALAAASALLGLAQVMAPKSVDLHLHEGPLAGHAAGVFQLVNHQPTLLLMAAPFLAVLLSRLGAQFQTGDTYLGRAILILTLMLTLAAGVAAAGSVAGYALVLPVVVASIAVVLPRGMSFGVFAPVLLLIAVLGATIFYVSDSPLIGGAVATDLDDGPLSRIGNWKVASEMAGDFFPVGAGLGAFQYAYGTYEDPALVTNSFLAHAHNDYLEIIVELGLAGMLLLAGFLAWWLVTTIALWRQPIEEGLRTRRAASVAVAVVLLHSLVDSPARTPAIACMLAYCIGLMASAPKRQAPSASQITLHRHVEL